MCSAPANIYGQETASDVSNSILQHVGYFHPTKAGTYSFEPNSADEVVYLWFGDNAKSGFSETNANLVAVANDDGLGQGTYEYNVQESDVGGYVPFRLLWINTQTCGQFSMIVNDPDGVQIVSRGLESTDEFGYDCGADTVAPPFEI
jgi:hypothetical protein